MKRKLKILLAAAMALLLAIAPCALAETAYHASLIRFPTKLVGFTSENTTIFSAPTEFSARIAVGCGFPLYVTGSAGQFYIVENAAGVQGYALKRAVSPNLTKDANPFTGGYDPGWGKTACMILLPQHMTVRAQPRPSAAAMSLDAATPCWILQRTANNGSVWYAVQNAANGAIAYFSPSDLLDTASNCQWHA